MPNDDKIYEAYCGKKGEELQSLTKERIQWILSYAEGGESLLDVGCSQGIISLLLGERYSKVDGIDIQEESIAFAKELQREKYPELQESVHFICDDFLEYYTQGFYECIVMTEVLEHLSNPEDFLKHAKGLLKENGTLILSVPFSLNKHPDHKRTYYVSDFYDLVSPLFYIERIVYVGNWIGIVARKAERANPEFKEVAEELLREEERQFFKLDQSLQEKSEKWYELAQTANKKAKLSEENYIKCKDWLDQRNKELEKEREMLTACKEKAEAYRSNYETCKGWLAQRTKESEEYQARLKLREEELATLKGAKLDEELARCLLENDQSVELLLNAGKVIQQLQTQNAYLKTENENYARKFAKITSTWYGSFGLKCYHWLQKRKWKLQALVRKLKRMK